MKPRLLVVHGIHTNDTEGWMDQFVGAFRRAGWSAEKWTYGYAYALLTRWQNPARARTLAGLLDANTVALGHSNGGCLIWMAAQLGAPMRGAILLNPALDTDKALACHVPWVNLYANRGDEAVKVAKVFPAHPWGSQGREGLAIDDPRYRTTFTDAAPPSPMVWGHSDIFTPRCLAPWVDRIRAEAEARLA